MAGIFLSPLKTDNASAGMIPGAKKEEKMKKILFMVAITMVVIAMASGAFAGTTTSTVAATATITNTCVAGGSPAVAFGSLDASVAGPYAGVITDPTLWCTTGDSVAVTNNGGQNFFGTFRLKSGVNFIPYTLTYTTPLTGQGKAIDIGGQGAGKLSLTASIAAGNIDSAPAGAYSDSVVLTFTY